MVKELFIYMYIHIYKKKLSNQNVYGPHSKSIVMKFDSLYVYVYIYIHLYTKKSGCKNPAFSYCDMLKSL